MMRTEDDIRRALDTETDHDALGRLVEFAADLDRPVHADTLGEAVLSASGNGRWHRVLPLLAAAAAVIVLAAGATYLTTRRPSSQAGGDGYSAEQRRPVWNLRVASVPGYTFTRGNASSIGLANGSTTSIAATDAKRPERGVMTTCPGPFHDCSDTTGVRDHVRIHGREGVFIPGGHVARASLPLATYLAHPWLAAANDDNQPSLAWDAGFNITVFLSGTFGFDPKTFTYDNAAAKKILLRIASATSAGHVDATHLPFALTELPGKVAAETVRVNTGGACGGYGTGPRSADDPLGLVFTACRVRTGRTSAATIAAADRVDSNPTNGTAHFEPDSPIVHDFADGTSIVIAVDSDERSIVSLRQARDLAAHADVSPRLDDQSSWLTVG